MMKTRKLAVAVIAAMLALPLAASADTWTGWITDSHCGAAGARAGHKDCALKCMKGGSKLVFYNNADKKLYQLDNQDMAKEHLGHEVTVTGSVDGDAIKIEKIDMAKAPAK